MVEKDEESSVQKRVKKGEKSNGGGE